MNNIIKLDCAICQDKKRQSVFIPCGHRATCKDCGLKIFKETKKCPICKLKCDYFQENIFNS